MAVIPVRMSSWPRNDVSVDGRLREAGGPPRCIQHGRVLLKSTEHCLYCGPIDPSA